MIDAKRIRNKFNLTQQEFSNILGIGIASVKRFENGISVPTGIYKKIYSAIDKFPLILEVMKEQ